MLHVTRRDATLHLANLARTDYFCFACKLQSFFSKWYQRPLLLSSSFQMKFLRTCKKKVKGILGTLVATNKSRRAAGKFCTLFLVWVLWILSHPLHTVRRPKALSISLERSRISRSAWNSKATQGQFPACSSQWCALAQVGAQRERERKRERDESKGGIERPASLFKEQAKIKHACINLECQSRRRSLLLSPYLWYQRSVVRLPGFPVFGLSSEAELGVSRM